MEYKFAQSSDKEFLFLLLAAQTAICLKFEAMLRSFAPDLTWKC